MTNLISVLCVLIEFLSRAHVEGKRLYDFKFGNFIGRFPSDGAASMAVKGLTMAHGAGFNNQGDDGYGQ